MRISKDFDIHQYDFFNKIKKLDFVEKIILFGSRARKDHREKSDIDLAIVCPLANDDQWLQVIDYIDNADTLLKIDCVRMDTLLPSSELKANILKEGMVMCQK